MSNKRKKTRPPRPHTTTEATEKEGSKRWAWAGLLIPLAALLILAGLGVFDDSENGRLDVKSTAPAFDLPTTEGTRVSLEGVLADGPALLYFAMGVGCDICFYQIPEVNQGLADMGVTLVPIMVEEESAVANEAKRLGVTTPILIDRDLKVSRSYDMIGLFGHGMTPTHSFALVDRDGQVTWRFDYPDVFVPFEQLLADLGDLI